MKRLPLLVSFLLFVALCASIAYWALQLFKPPLRPVAAPPRTAQAEVSPDAAAALFGGRPGKTAVASNYQLRGVIMAGPRDSVAIISADGKPAQAIRIGMELAPGVSVKEVQRDYVLLSDGGASKRVELPESAKGLPNIASAAPVATRPTAPPPPAITPPSAQPSARSQSMPPSAFQQPATAAPVPPATVVPPAAPQNPAAPQSQAGTLPVTQAAPPVMVVSPSAAQSSGTSASGSNGASGAPAQPSQGVPAQTTPSAAAAGTGTRGATQGTGSLTFGERPLQQR
jgi:general secretion pathway protein C